MLFRRITIVAVLIARIPLSNSQENDPSSHSTSITTSQSRQLEQLNCRDSGKCFDAGPYTATVTDILESETPNSHQVRLLLSFNNVSDSAIILAYRAHSAFLLDNFKNRFFCCKSDNAPDSSAVGMGIDAEGKVDPQLILKPHESAIVIFDLWRRRPPNLQASYFDFNLMIDQIDPSNRFIIQKNPYLSFRGLLPRRRTGLQGTESRVIH
jgi:hypothetical protein